MKKLNDIYMEQITRISEYQEISKMNWKLVFGILFVICHLSFVICSAGADGYLNDPMTIGVGARPLGMGKAYVGVAEDGDAVFMNPAGLARITNPKLSTMYTQLLGDVNYMVVGGAYPYGEKSAFGAGIVNARVSDIPMTNSTGASIGSGSWGNSVMFLSYGTYLSNTPLQLNLGRDVLLGGSLKYYSVGGTGTGVSDGTGSGFDIDLGVLYPASEYVILGANLQNILPSSMGGKITKTSGAVDTIPSTIKVGTKISLIGKEGASFSPHATRKLYGNIDYDYLPYSKSGIVHAGLEFWPVSSLALRAGSDNSDLTAGVGLRFSGVEFNYAYHPYSGITDNTTHFFSIGYLGEARKRELKIALDGPADKAVVYEDHVKVNGKVTVVEGDDDSAPAGPLTIKLNGATVPVGADQSFSADIPVNNYGKNLVLVEASDASGAYQKQEARLVRLTSFADVPDGYWAKQPIENNATVGMVQGYPDGTFRPENALTRAELATLLVRAKGIKIKEGRAKQIFKDTKSDFWAARYIEIAQKEGLVKGYPDKTFRPNNKISKVEGIVVMARFDQLKLADVDAKPYWDVAENHWAAKSIQAAKESGMLKFVEKNRLHPKEALARSEAVDMLAKTSLAGGKIKDLYTWEKGFGPEMLQRPQVKASLY